MHRLLASQIAKCTPASGSIDGERLIELIDATYEQFDKDRARSDRATRLMIEEVETARAAEEAERAERERQQEEALELKRRQLAAEAASQAKSSFLAVMSHEIRTPMNAVLGFSSALLEEDIPHEHKSTVEAIKRAGEALLHLVDNILDYSKLESGKIELEVQPFSLRGLVADVLSLTRPRATAKGLEMTSVVDIDVGESFAGDAPRLRQVLLNIISNAVKFTENGTIGIHVRRGASWSGGTAIECTVRDTGIGIAEDRVAALFGEFVQGDCSINRRFGGTGLGLAICRRIIEAMGGTISISSTLGKGTEVRLVVCLATCDGRATEVPKRKSTARELKALLKERAQPVRILIVDDNATNLIVAKRLIEKFGVGIDTANNGKEAISATIASKYDAIFMDMRMPEMDGLEATRAIRAGASANKKVPIIAFTANAFQEDRDACIASGMTGFISKPVRTDKLAESLLEALSGNYEARFPKSQPPPSRTTATVRLDKELIDLGAFSELSDNLGSEAMTEAVAAFLNETSGRLEYLKLQLRKGSTADAANEAHALKGASRTLGLAQLSDLAEQIERLAQDDGLSEIEPLITRASQCFEQSRAMITRLLVNPVGRPLLN